MIYDFQQQINGSVAQLAERALRMREAPGSKPGVSTIFFSVCRGSYCFAILAKIK